MSSHISHSSFSRSRGFTIVEILIVLSIVGILAMILLPVVSKMRDNAGTAVCASNLKQIGMAIRMYADDNGGFYPGITPPGMNCGWIDRLERYVKSPTTFECPAFEEGEYRPGCPTPDSSSGVPITYHGSYDINDLRAGRFRVLDTFFKHPSSTIVVLDGKGTFVNPGADPISDTEDLILRGVQVRHNNGSNVLFADSHVKWLHLDAMTKQSLWLTKMSN